MKKLATLMGAVVVGCATILASLPASAGPSEHLNWGYNLMASETSCPAGERVVNIMHKVINGMDSGTNGNHWAYDEYVRQIQVVQTGENTFCATAKYQGNFETVTGYSPGCNDEGTCATNGNVGESVVGTFQGGYTATITGTLNPSYRTKGSIGAFDYQCDPPSSTCLSIFNWVDAYFDTGWGFTFEWWGWVYHAGNNGSWVNAASGNSGDITGD